MRDITPPKFRCAAEDECPTVFEDGDELVIVGKVEVDPNDMVARKIGKGETAIRIKRGLISDLV